MDITPEFIRRVFSKSKIDPKYMDVLTNPEALAIYRVAFTSNTVDSDSNYELYEYMGDVAANAAVVMYFYEAFLSCDAPGPSTSSIASRSYTCQGSPSAR